MVPTSASAAFQPIVRAVRSQAQRRNCARGSGTSEGQSQQPIHGWQPAAHPVATPSGEKRMSVIIMLPLAARSPRPGGIRGSVRPARGHDPPPRILPAAPAGRSRPLRRGRRAPGQRRRRCSADDGDDRRRRRPCRGGSHHRCGYDGAGRARRASPGFETLWRAPRSSRARGAGRQCPGQRRCRCAARRSARWPAEARSCGGPHWRGDRGWRWPAPEEELPQLPDPCLPPGPRVVHSVCDPARGKALAPPTYLAIIVRNHVDAEAPVTVRAHSAMRPTPLLLCLVALVVGGLFIGSAPDLTEERIRQLAADQSWSVVSWEAGHLPQGAALALDEWLRPPGAAVADAAIAAYLRGERTASDAQDGALTLAIGSAIAGKLRTDGVQPLGHGVFPPVVFAFDHPPRVLVVSPRTEIRIAYSELLIGDAPLAQVEALEQAVERFNLSALVVDIGGIATYPTL